MIRVNHILLIISLTDKILQLIIDYTLTNIKKLMELDGSIMGRDVKNTSRRFTFIK